MMRLIALSKLATPGGSDMYSLIVPVYRNEESIPDLLMAIESVSDRLSGKLEVVFVIDGSPDRCAEMLNEKLPSCNFPSRLIVLSRNFGSFSAIRTGLAEATGKYFAIMAADLQEPPELSLEFFKSLESEDVDFVFGTRDGRADPLLSRSLSRLFWFMYRKFIQPEMPPGGVDMFGCNQAIRDQLLVLDESNSSLVGLLFWIGFKKKSIPYRRLPRKYGKSAWTLTRKFRYLSDNVYSFSNLPIRLLTLSGAIGLLVSFLFGGVVLFARVSGLIDVPGYAAIVLTVIFFAALNMFGLGIIGNYVWRTFENTKKRPESIVMNRLSFGGKN